MPGDLCGYLEFPDRWSAETRYESFILAEVLPGGEVPKFAFNSQNVSGYCNFLRMLTINSTSGSLYTFLSQFGVFSKCLYIWARIV